MAEESRFAKIARVSVTQGSANAITFNEFQTGVGLQVGASRGKGMAMLIDQIDYYMPNLMTALLLDTDIAMFGITTSDQIPNGDAFDDQRVLHCGAISKQFTTSGAVILVQPLVFQFFPALIWADPTLFVMTDGVSLAVAVELNVRIYFRLVELDQQLIFEVAQQFRIIS